MAKKKGTKADKTKLINQRNIDGLTQAQLATAADVPLSCIVKAELRGRRTNDTVLDKIAAALNVNINAIT